MTIDDWVRAAAPAVLADYAWRRSSTRKKRLYVCACCRLIWDELHGSAIRAAVAVAEAFAEGWTDTTEFAEARARAEDEARSSEVRVRVDAPAAPAGASMSTHLIWQPSREQRLTAFATWAMSEPLKSPRWGLNEFLSRDLLLDIFGNPFRRVAISPRWRTSAVTALAGAIYTSQDYALLPIMADALQDAGCSHPLVLAHCRADAPHARGCWVVDAILGKS